MYGTLKNSKFTDEDQNEEKKCGPLTFLCNSIWRVKKERPSVIEETALARVLNTFDLTILGIGSTLGVGVYVLAGEVSKNIAGPSVIICFLLAAITSVFAGLCYAEFGARVPKAGSAYAYSYYTVGEGIAFVIGWSLLIEYGIGAASVAKGISEYVNRISGNVIAEAFLSAAPMNVPYLAEYVDFFAAGLCLFLALVLAVGVRTSTVANNIFTLLNLSVVLFVIISGLFKVDIKNWKVDPEDIPPGVDGGEGGFFPFGFIGVMQGAATCFYGFVGFDAIATTGEEVKNPQKAIPLAFVISLSVIFCVYFGISSVLTLMWPYWDQSATAPFPHVYDKIDWDIPKWIVTVGACFGLFSSLFGAMFPLPRIIYSMAHDGLIFKFLGTVNKKTKTPIYGALIAGLVTAVMAGVFNLRQLVDMMSLGTLMAYSIVALCVLILRYSPDNPEETTTERTVLVESSSKFSCSDAVRSYFNCRNKTPTVTTKRIVVFNLVLFICLSIGFALTMTYLHENIFVGEWYGILVLSIIVVFIILVFISIATQPQSQKKLSFQIPLLPLIPCLSMFCNIYLMIVLDTMTWVRFAVWMALGIIPYFLWFSWKFYRGELNENSPYEINRINTIRLNEEVLKMRWHKETILKGIHNPAFVEENYVVSDRYDKMEINQAEIKIVDENVIPVSFAVEQEVDDLSLHEVENTRFSIEIVNFNERASKMVDDNNNEMDLQKAVLSVAEVHREDEQWEEIVEENSRRMNDDFEEIVNESYGFLNEDEKIEVKVEQKKEEPKLLRRNSRLSEIYLENINKKEVKEEVVVEKPKRSSKLEEKFLDSIGEISKSPEKNSEAPEVLAKPKKLEEKYLNSIGAPLPEMNTEKISKPPEVPPKPKKLEEKYFESIGVPKPPPLPEIITAKPSKPPEVAPKLKKLEGKYLESIGAPPLPEIITEKPPEVAPKPKKLEEKYFESIGAPKPPPLPEVLTSPSKPPKVPPKPKILHEKFLENVEAPKPPPPPETADNRPELPPKPSIADLIKQIQGPKKPLKHVEPKTKDEPPKLSFKDRLSKILKEQMSEISYRSSLPKEQVQEENYSLGDENLIDYEKYKTIRTLSKAALKDRLEIVLTRGPPKRASLRDSFRGSIDDDDLKRKNTVNALRQIENQAIEPVELKNELIDDKAESEEEFISRKQKMLMGNVLKTIKLKNQLTDNFLNDR